MKTTSEKLFAVGAAVLVGGLFAVPLSNGQTQVATNAAGEAELSALVQEIADQQATIAKNHQAMDEKIALIAEEVRQARLFAARGGNNGKR